MGSGPRVGVWGRRWVEEGKAAGPGELESEAAPPLMGPVKVYRWGGVSWVPQCSSLGGQVRTLSDRVLRALGGWTPGGLDRWPTAIQAAEGVTSCVPFQRLPYCGLDPHG